MTEDRGKQSPLAFRKRLEQAVSNCDRLLDGTACAASDELAQAHAIRRRAKEALAALDAGDEIPPPLP